MSYSNSGKRKRAKTKEHVDLENPCEEKHFNGLQKDLHSVIACKTNVNSDLELDLDLGLDVNIASKHATFFEHMKKPYGNFGYEREKNNSSINDFNDLKAADKEQYMPRSHTASGCDELMAQNSGDPLGRRRSRPSLEDLSTAHGEEMPCKFSEARQRQTQHGFHILKVPVVELMSNNELHKQPWANVRSRLKPTEYRGGAWQPEIDEEPDWPMEGPQDRGKSLVGVRPTTPPRMRPSSEPPRLRLPSSQYNYHDKFQSGKQLNHQAWAFQAPEETTNVLEEAGPGLPFETMPSKYPTVERSRDTRSMTNRKMWNPSQQEMSAQGKERLQKDFTKGVKSKTVDVKHETHNLENGLGQNSEKKQLEGAPCFAGYSPPKRDNIPFRRNSKTFAEIRAANPEMNGSKVQYKQEEEDKNNDDPEPCHKNYSPSSSRDKKPFKRASSPSLSFKKSEVLKPSFSHEVKKHHSNRSLGAGEIFSSPKFDKSKKKQMVSRKKSATDLSSPAAISSPRCIPGFSPRSGKQDKSPSKSPTKSSVNKGGKTRSKQKQSGNKCKSLNTKKARSQSPVVKSKSFTSPNSRSKSKKASPTSSQTRVCPPTYLPAPCESSSRTQSPKSIETRGVRTAKSKSPSNSPRKSPSYSRSRSNTTLKSGKQSMKKERSWGSLAETIMPVEPTFLPSFYDDFRATSPSPGMNMVSSSQFARDSSGNCQGEYPKVGLSSSPKNYADYDKLSHINLPYSTHEGPSKSPSRNAKTKSGANKTGKKGKRAKRDKNENKQHKSKSGKKRSSKSSRSEANVDTSREKCLPSYNPCPNKSPRATAIVSPPKATELTPKKDQQITPASRSSKSRLGSLCRKCKEFSPKSKFNIRWPTSCRRRCGQSMPRTGVLSAIGELFGSQLRAIASNRGRFPGITPLYISDAMPVEWFRYPEVQETGGGGTGIGSSGSRLGIEKQGTSQVGLARSRPSGISSDSSVLVPTDNETTHSVKGEDDSDREAGGDLQTVESTEDAAAKRSGSESQGGSGSGGSQDEGPEEGGTRRGKRSHEELQKSEAQCYRMRATVRSNKDCVEVNLEECNGVMCRSQRRSDSRKRVGRRRSTSRDSEGRSRGMKHDGGGGGGGGGGSRRASSTGRSGSASKGKSMEIKGSSLSTQETSRKSSVKQKETDSVANDSEQQSIRRKRRASPSNKGKDAGRKTEKHKIQKKSEENKHHEKQPITITVAKSRSSTGTRQNKKELTASEGSGSYSTTKENVDELSQSKRVKREDKCSKIVVSSDKEKNVSVKRFSSDSDCKDCKLVSTCRQRRYRGTTNPITEENVSESEVECKEFICGDDRVKVCNSPPRHFRKAHNRPDQTPTHDDSANWSGSNVQDPQEHRRSPTRAVYNRLKKQNLPILELSSSQLSSELLTYESRSFFSRQSPSDSYVDRKISYDSERKAREDTRLKSTISSSSPVDPHCYDHAEESRNPSKVPPGAGDEMYRGNLKNQQSDSYVTTPASYGTLTPSFLPSNERRQELSDNYFSESERDNQLAKVIKGRMKFLSVDDGTASVNNKHKPSSKSTSVGISNGTVKMAASPENMKIIPCDPDDAFERSAERGLNASLRTSIESIAVDDEDFFISRPNPDATSIARYERDSQYIKMRQQRLEMLERTINACDTDNCSFAPKSQYLNRVSRRRRSQGRAMSSKIRHNDAVTAILARGETCKGDGGLRSVEKERIHQNQSMAKHPELLDQFNRIITPEQALRLAEARTVTTTDSDASGLISDVYVKPLVHHKNNSQNNDGSVDLREQQRPNKRSGKYLFVNKEPQSGAPGSQTESRCISNDRYLTPPSVEWDNSNMSPCCQTNNCSVLPSERPIFELHGRNSELKDDTSNSKNSAGQLGNQQACFKQSGFSMSSEPLRNCYKTKQDSGIKYDQSGFNLSNFVFNKDQISKNNCNETVPKNKNPSVYRLVMGKDGVSTGTNIWKKVFSTEKTINGGSEHDLHPKFTESGFGEESMSLRDICYNMPYTDVLSQELRDINQSSNTGDVATMNRVLTGESPTQIEAIDTFKPLSHESAFPYTSASFSRETGQVEYSSSLNAGLNQFSPSLRHYGHLSVPLQRTQMSRLATNVNRPKKYFAESESDLSITSDDDHLIQMAKSLPAFSPDRSAEDCMCKKIRRNSMRALLYATSITSLSPHKGMPAVEAKIDSLNSFRPRTHEFGDSPCNEWPRLKLSSFEKRLNNNQNSEGGILEALNPNHTDVNVNGEPFLCEDTKQTLGQNQKKYVDSSTLCHLLPSTPPQSHSTLSRVCQQISSDPRLLTKLSTDLSNTDCSSPLGHKTEESKYQRDESILPQPVEGQYQGGVTKLCTGDGEEFWILSAAAMKRLFPTGYPGTASNLKEKSTNVVTGNSEENVKNCMPETSGKCMHESFNKRGDGKELEVESSPLVFEEELNNDMNQNKREACGQIHSTEYCNSSDFETKTDQSGNSTCPKLNAEISGLLSASQPYYFLEHDELFSVADTNKDVSCHALGFCGVSKSQENIVSPRVKERTMGYDVDTELINSENVSNNKKQGCDYGIDLNFSHLSQNESGFNPDLTANVARITVEAEQQVVGEEPKSSSVDPLVLRSKKRNRRKHFSSVDPPWFDNESNGGNEDYSCTSRDRGIEHEHRSVEKRDRGDQIGTDLDEAIRNQLQICYGLRADEVLQNMRKTGLVEAGDTVCIEGKSVEAHVRARKRRTRSQSQTNARSISKSSKSTQVSDTLSLISSSTVTSDRDSDSLSDTLFDKPSVVVVSMSGNGRDTPVKAMDSVMHKGHKSILLEWLKSVVPGSFLSSAKAKGDEPIERERKAQRRRGSSEPRRSHRDSTGRRRRVASASRADRYQDNSSNALTTTDLSIDDITLRSPSLCSASLVKKKMLKEKRKRFRGDHELLRHASWLSGNHSLDGQKSVSLLTSAHELLKEIENTKKKKKKSSESPQRDHTTKNYELTNLKKERKKKSRRVFRNESNGAYLSLDESDFSLNHPRKLNVDSESEITEDGDQSIGQSCCGATASGSETKSALSSGLKALRERFDKLVADLDTLYRRDSHYTSPKTVYTRPTDTMFEFSMRDSLINGGSSNNPSSLGEGTNSSILFRRKEKTSIPFSSEFLRDLSLDDSHVQLSREENLMRQYSSNGLSDRRLFGFSNLSAPITSSRILSDFRDGLRYRSANYIPDMRFQSVQSPLLDHMSVYPNGSQASGYMLNETNNKNGLERKGLNETFNCGSNNGAYSLETYRASGYLTHEKVNSTVNPGSNREAIRSNWNENANNGDQAAHDDDSSSKSSTDEDFLEFEMQESEDGAKSSRGGIGVMSTAGVELSSESLPDLTSKQAFSDMGDEKMPNSRSTYARENLFGLLSEAIPVPQCLCPTCGCRSNNYQSSRKQDLFPRKSQMALRNISGTGNITGKEPYTQVNVGAACGGLATDMLPKDVSGGNNKASEEEFVSAIEHLSSTVRHCYNLMPRHIWNECQEMDDTSNHQQESNFYIGDGSGESTGYRRVDGNNCPMHVDDEHTGISKLHRGQHCDPNIATSNESNRRQPWQLEGTGANAVAPAQHPEAGLHTHCYNVGSYLNRTQPGRFRRNGLIQWYHDMSKPTKNMETVSEGKLTQKISNEMPQSKVNEGKDGCRHSSSECSSRNHMFGVRGGIGEDEDEEDEDDDPANFEEALEEEEDDDEDDEESGDDEDDADDDEDENYNKEIIRQRGARDLCQSGGELSNLHGIKDFTEASKQAGDMDIQRQVATITNGRFTAEDQARLAEYGAGETKMDHRVAGDSPRNNIRQKKFSLDQIKVPVIEKERVRFACDESGDWAEIGRGSYGCVYLGLLDASIEVAIKDFYEASSWELVIHEARMLMFLQDTGITPRLFGLRRRFDVSKQPSEYCIIMEYFGDGRTLFNVMSDKIPLRMDEWLDIVGQLVAGLRLIHRKGVLINDLKADNILVDLTKGRKVIRYIDVGMATYKQGLTFQLPEDQMNRYNFLAPEVREGGRTTTRSDIYSLGYMLEQMCRLADSALGGLRKLVARCMDKRPGRRPDLDDIVSQVHRFIGAKASRSAACSSPREHPLLNNSV